MSQRQLTQKRSWLAGLVAVLLVSLVQLGAGEESPPAVGNVSVATTMAPVNAIAAEAMDDAVRQLNSARANGTESAGSSLNTTTVGGSPGSQVSRGNATAGFDPKSGAAVSSASTAANASTNAATAAPEPADDATKKFDQYFEPVCEHLQKLTAKQMFKVQSQLKKFVEASYAFDPSLVPASKAQLEQICKSRDEPTAPIGAPQFKNFESCATKNWEPVLSLELAQIHKARQNCAKNHQHSKNDGSLTVAHEEGDEDEVSVVGDAVSKVLGDSKEGVSELFGKAAEIGANLGLVPKEGTPSAGTSAPSVAPATPATPTPAPTIALSTAAPSSAAPPTSGPSTEAPTSAAPTPTPKTSSASASVEPQAAGTSTTTSAPATSEAPAQTTGAPKPTAAADAAEAERSGEQATKSASSLLGKLAEAPGLSGGTSRPAAAEASTSTSKPEESRSGDGTTEAPEPSTKSNILSEAKKAIEALKAQRANGHGSAADERMHQIEHERQMNIDPVGHTIKHRIYEMKRAGLGA